MSDARVAEYVSALEQACVQLKMLQYALWTKDLIDDEDETALQRAMSAPPFSTALIVDVCALCGQRSSHDQ